MRFFYSRLTLMLVCISLLSVNEVHAQSKYLSFKDRTLKQIESESSTPTRTIIPDKSNIVDLKYSFPGAYISETIINSEKYNFIHIDGFSKLKQVGAPALPSRNEVIAMPRGSEAQIKIMNSKYIEFDGYMVHPALEPARDTEGAKSPEFKIDKDVFSKNTWFPQNNVEILKVNYSRGTPLVVVKVTPIQFNPVTRKIRVCTDIEFSIIPVGGETNFEYISRENSENYTNNLKRTVINSESIPDGVKKTSIFPKDISFTPKNYIIITHSEYIDEANRLANWKRQLGYSVEVISRASWTAEEVKNEVHERYAAWTPKPDYMLIIGDHNGDFAVPGEIHQDPNDGADFATDNYVVCMDGSSDYYPDMAKGRISVSSRAEATVVIDKIINYEKVPTINNAFYENILNCAQYQDTDDNDGYADRRFCHTSEEIRDYLQNEQGYTSERVYYRETGEGTAAVDNLRYNDGEYSDGQLLPAELRSTSFNWSGDQNDITAAIDAGKFFVFHRDHGYVGGSGWAHPYYTTNSMENLANNELLPVVFSMNCHTGEFQLDNCFAEKFLRMENKGAVGVVAAAYYSYSGYNDAISIGMVDAIWPDPGLFPDFGSNYDNGVSYTMGGTEGLYTMGDVVNQGLYSMTQNYFDNTYTFELFHYFGDPAMKIWTDNPNDTIITATHNTIIDCAQNAFAISGSQPYAIATLVCKNKLVGKTTLDATGSGSIPYMIAASGDVILTISKHNCIPYASTLTQTCSDFPPEIDLIDAKNIVEYSATIGGRIINDFGHAVTESGILYSTSPDIDFEYIDVTKVQTTPVALNDTFQIDVSLLLPSTLYYYKAYAINAVDTSLTVLGYFTTLSDISYVTIWTEDFENGDSIPDGWMQEQVNSSGVNWTFIEGNGDSFPETAHSGTYNACLRDESTAENKSRLISSSIDLSGQNSVVLNFWHTQVLWGLDQDELTVYYKTSATENWIELTSYTSNNSSWTEEYVELPEVSSDFYLCFEGNAKYGYGVCLDDVSITLEQRNTPETRLLANAFFDAGSNTCYDALQTISIAGDGYPVFVEAGVNANFIAGQSIRFLPGFHAEEGSYINAHITTNGSFCDDMPAPLMAVEPVVNKSLELGESDQEEDVFEKQSMMVYPNPNNGIFTIKLTNIDSDTKVLMYNSVGQKVYDVTITEQLNSIELPNVKRGIYFIKAVNKQKQFNQKMIIQ